MKSSITSLCRVAIIAGAAAALAPAAHAQQLATTRIASGLAGPVFVTSPRGDNNRLFVVEQRNSTSGRIRVINIPGNTLNSAIYLTINPVATGGEQGLLGLAFHPDFLNNGYFYVYYTRAAVAGVSYGNSVVARYRANAPYATSTTADASSAQVLLDFPQPDANHNAGWIAFGPDGNLYIATGDGGCGNDSNCGGNSPTITPPGHTPGTGNAQDVTGNLYGKLLRLDVDGPDNIPGNADDADPANAKPYRTPAGNPFNGTNGDREIFCYGLRNPWRNSFDRQTGDLWIADVGQGAREEINFVPAGMGPGLNFGWRCIEGTRATGLSGCNPSDQNLFPPILEYGHGENIAPTFIHGCSITGGYVYRGSAIPCLQGNYIFADYCSADIWTFKRSATGPIINLVNRTAELAPGGTQAIQGVTSFGEDNQGELYICDQSGGEIFKIIPSTASQGPDCNGNGVPDACEIANGDTTDANGDGIPDSCQCDSDLNHDGNADQGDIDYLINVVAGGPNGTGIDPDFNRDGNVDQGDIDALINVVAGGACP
ncbi:MAG: PQQ-dependent sugar dehydrogenase [Phycisphaerales bacterium]|jgi:glucose/arabinose dehydrogenase